MQEQDQEAIEYWFEFILARLENNRPAEVEQELVGMGWSSEDAQDLVGQVRVVKRNAVRKDGWGKVILGTVVALVGGGITGGTYLLAGPGGTYVVAWGIIIFGVVWLLIGLVRVANPDTNP